MVIEGYTWLYMVTGGYTWLYMVIHGYRGLCNIQTMVHMVYAIIMTSLNRRS